MSKFENISSEEESPENSEVGGEADENISSEEESLEDSELGEETSEDPSAEVIPIEELGTAEEPETLAPDEGNELNEESINNDMEAEEVTTEEEQSPESPIEMLETPAPEPEEVFVAPSANESIDSQALESARIEELHNEIAATNAQPEQPKEEQTDIPGRIEISTLAKAESGGSDSGGGGAEGKIIEEMQKPPLLMRLLYALFGVSWEKRRVGRGGGGGSKGGESTASSKVSIDLGGKQGSEKSMSK